MENLWNSLRMFLWLTFITGIAYPLIVTGIAHLTMGQKAEGGFVSSKDKIVGAELIAQKFESNKYFWARPSAVDYNPLPSGGSNLGPTSAALKKAVEERQDVIAKAHDLKDKIQIPSELLFASGSGLDPHISPEAAQFQIDRIIKARGWEQNQAREEISKLIVQNTEGAMFEFLEQPRINVLKLNLALDELNIASAKSEKEKK